MEEAGKIEAERAREFLDAAEEFRIVFGNSLHDWAMMWSELAALCTNPVYDCLPRISPPGDPVELLDARDAAWILQYHCRALEKWTLLNLSRLDDPELLRQVLEASRGLQTIFAWRAAQASPEQG
jgi:hypothetical protein